MHSMYLSIYKLNLADNPNFVKIIEQEYATRYLESMNIEPSHANISKILEKYPLKNCEIVGGWNSNNFFKKTTDFMLIILLS